jgi:Lysine-2,3-aminomutase
LSAYETLPSSIVLSGFRQRRPDHLIDPRRPGRFLVISASSRRRCSVASVSSPNPLASSTPQANKRLYDERYPIDEDFLAALALIAAGLRLRAWFRPAGDDPLVLPASRLRKAVEALAAIDHVKVVRIHTRVPAVAPECITADMIDAIRARGKATYVVLHANHPRELTPAARAACAQIIDAGIPMLSQSVLLRGVNDDADILAELMRAFVACRIKPYYLHHADLAPGTGHLRTSIEAGQDLMRRLRGRVSGLCQPAYMLDIPGGAGKVPIGPQYIASGDSETSAGEIEVGDRRNDARLSMTESAGAIELGRGARRGHGGARYFGCDRDR